MNCSKFIDNHNAKKCKQCRLIKYSVQNIKSLNLHAYHNVNMSKKSKYTINKPNVAESAIRCSRDEFRKLRRCVLHCKV